MQKHIDSGMLERFDTYENLKDSFCDAVYDASNKEQFRALSPVHLVLQDKDTHKIRTTIDYSGLNILFSKGSNLLPPIHEKVAEFRAGKYVLAMTLPVNISKSLQNILQLNVSYTGKIQKMPYLFFAIMASLWETSVHQI